MGVSQRPKPTRSIPPGEITVEPGLRRSAYARDVALLLTFDGVTLFSFVGASATPKWQKAFERPIASVVIGPGKGEATVVDDGGGAHAVNLASGEILRSIAPVGAPVAVAAAGALAIATKDRVFLTHEGKTHEIERSAISLAFSRDGATLAIGTKKGSLILVDVATREVQATHELGLPMRCLVSGPNGEWVAANGQGLFSIKDGDEAKLIERAVMRVALDADGKRVAVQRSPSKVAVYAWPPAQLLVRMLLDEPRRIEDIAFDAGGSLSIALDGEDACIVDLSSLEIRHAVVPHEGGENREWKLRLQRDKTTAVAGPTPVDPPAKSSAKWKWGLGTAVLAVLVFIRIFNRTATTHTPKDLGAAHTHARTLKGRAEATDRFVLQRLRGPELTATDDAVLVESSNTQVWVGPDSATYLLSTGSRASKCSLQVKPAAGEWRTNLTRDCSSIQLFGRGEHDVYAAFDGDLFAYDGTKEWKSIGMNETPIVSLAGITIPGADDLFILTEDGRLQHRHGGAWTVDPQPREQEIDQVFSGPTLWAHASTDKKEELLFHLGLSGSWVRRWTPRDGEPFEDLWAGSDRHLFVAKKTEIAMSTSDGESWEQPVLANAHVNQLWGRSNTDVYAAGARGLWHFDGTAWTKTPFDKRIEAIAGDARDLVVVVKTQ